MQQEQSISSQNLSDSRLNRFGFHSKKPSDSAFYKAFFSMYPLLVLQNVVTLSVNLADNMMLGAYYGGIAITGSGTTAVHALSYPLGGKFHIAHGVSNAILFAHVMAFNKDGCEPQLAQICDAINPQLAKESESVRAQYVIDQIAEIVRDTNIPTDLNQYGVSMEDLDFLVTAGSQQQRLLVNNCKELSLEDIREIYLKVLK